MNKNHGCLTIASGERTTGDLFSSTLRPADKTAALTMVQYLERDLFDDGGHVRRGIRPERAAETVALINDLRRTLGWLEIDLDGRWRWPATLDHSDSVAGTPLSSHGTRLGSDQATGPDNL